MKRAFEEARPKGAEAIPAEPVKEPENLMNTPKEPTPSPVKEYLGNRDGRPGPRPLGHLDHLAFAVLLDAGESPAAAMDSLAKIRQGFVDWNEVRVARRQELARVLDGIDSAEECAVKILDEYNGFFEKKGCLGFDFLEAGKVAEGRKILHQLLPRVRKGAIGLLLYEFCPGAPAPLSDEALKTARKEGLIGKSGDRGQLGKVFAEHLTPEEAVRIIQYLELDATGNPYGEQLKAAQPKGAKTSARKSAGKK